MPRSTHRRHSRARTILVRSLIAVGVLVLIAGGGFYLAVQHLQSNITSVDVTHDLGKHRPKAVVKGPVNVLVMGDDTRKGQGPQIGGVTPGLSDTTILLHLSANRKFAYGVSLPRDAMVKRPACQTKHGVDPGGMTQFNAAYAIGGPACTIKTVEQLTGIRIDHFIVVKFRGFRQMVDAIGGVQVCVPQAISDPQSQIYFKPGTYNVDGEQALNYVRVRHGVGDGSDIGRMKRQQAFVASMIHKVVSAGTLANPIRLYNFLDAATKSLITDPGFSNLRALAGLGSSLKDIGLDHIKFITVPFQLWPPDPNRVQWAPAAKHLWTQIKYDRRLTGSLDNQVISAANTPGSKSSSTKPSGASKGAPSAAEVAAAQQVGLCS